MIVHRLNGYGVLTCLFVGNICGGIVARRSFGGDLSIQSGYYTLGFMIVVSGIMGIYYVKKDTRLHRKWMLRMVVFFAATISARLITLAAAAIITTIGTYYSVWRCDEVINVLTDPGTVQSLFPACFTAGLESASAWVAVRASTQAGAIYYASAFRAVHGMALWMATLIHIVGVEFYVRAAKEAYRKKGTDWESAFP
ncbi:hypothetical protein B0H11DRAFT_2159697 [Mycena galericulata]|nr:hypothetical protein B0H11DRAFT_2159697 [Mycena galericulata]